MLYILKSSNRSMIYRKKYSLHEIMIEFEKEIELCLNTNPMLSVH